MVDSIRLKQIDIVLKMKLDHVYNQLVATEFLHVN